MLCAPSLSGESFGMVLTEAFAAGTPVIASEIAGYSDVVTDGVDGVLVPPGDPQRLAEELQRVYLEPERLRGDGRGGPPERPALRVAARRRAGRGGLRAGDRGARSRRAPPSASPTGRPAPIDGSPPAPPQRLPSLDPAAGPRGQARPPGRAPLGLGVAGILGVGLTALAANKIGVDNVVASIVRSDLTWVSSPRADGISLFFRAASWYWIARAALPQPPASPPRRHLGDDDRRADVGDAAGTPRRAGARDGALAAHRAHARDLPGAARHARLADGVQHRRARRCSA